jgi:hypothetical protein
MNNAYREYIFELLHYKKNIEKLCTSLDKVVISQTMKLKLLTMLYVINADEYMYKTMNNIIHITVSYRFITLSEKNAIQECLDKLSNIISELRLKTSNDVFKYITNNFYIVKPFCDIFRSELKLYCYRRGVLLNSQKIESFCELEDENEANDYNLNDGNELIEDLTLLIGSNKYPRFSCVNHKANLAIRKTI